MEAHTFKGGKLIDAPWPSSPYLTELDAFDRSTCHFPRARHSEKKIEGKSGRERRATFVFARKINGWIRVFHRKKQERERERERERGENDRPDGIAGFRIKRVSSGLSVYQSTLASADCLREGPIVIRLSIEATRPVICLLDPFSALSFYAKKRKKNRRKVRKLREKNSLRTRIFHLHVERYKTRNFEFFTNFL